MILGLLLAGGVGLALGLLGGGGSILAVPIFVYVLGFGAKQAIAMSLAVVGVTSLVGAVGHWRVGNVDLRMALVFGAVAMVGTFGGARLAVFFTGGAQLVLFAGVMLASAALMFRDRRAGAGTAPRTGRMPLPLIAIEGATVGVLTGLVGVGGGFLVVPALVVLGGVPMSVAVGTSLVVIAMKSAAGFLGYLGQVEVPWAFMGAFTATAVVGVLGGSRLVPLVPQRALRQTFATFLLVMGTFVLYQNRAVFTGPGAVPEARQTLGH